MFPGNPLFPTARSQEPAEVLSCHPNPKHPSTRDVAVAGTTASGTNIIGHSLPFRCDCCIVQNSNFNTHHFSDGRHTRCSCLLFRNGLQASLTGSAAQPDAGASSKSITAEQGSCSLEAAELLKHRNLDGRHFFIISIAVAFPGQ